MADETQETQEAQAEQPKKSKGGLKLLIIIIGASLLFGAGGFVSYMLVSGKGEVAEHKEEKKQEEMSVLVPLEPFVVNLSAPGRYLKVTMQFELVDSSYESMVTQRMPILRDAVITLLSSKSTESVSGPEGKFQLKDEILFRANQAMGKEVFKNLYFTEFVMQ